MSPPLFMLRGRLDLAAFNRWAAERGLVLRGGFDEGYALHQLLVESFGTLAPRPFRLMGGRGGRSAVLYGYGTAEAAVLVDSAGRCADPLQCAALPVGDLMTKEMPADWAMGRSYGFEVRVRPVRRTDGERGRKSATERDAFQWEAERHPSRTMLRSREQVYADWLSERLNRQGGAVADGPVRLAAFQRTAVLRKRRDGRRNLSEGPDALLRGRLEVRDGAGFAHLLTEGIGRHKGFGYGMVLIRPG